MHKTAVLMFLALVLLPPVAQAELYKWVDGAGREFYTDDLAKVPPGQRVRARQMNPVEDPDKSQDKAPSETPPSSVKKPAKAKKSAGMAGQEDLDNNGRNEDWWRSRAEDLRSQIREEQENLEYFTEQQRACEESQRNKLVYKKDCAAQYEHNRKQSESNIERLRRKLEVDLPDEARKAGAYPGWLRD